MPIHNIVLEFQVKEKLDAADSRWIGPFRREGEIRNFIVFFLIKNNAVAQTWTIRGVKEEREDSTF